MFEDKFKAVIMSLEANTLTIIKILNVPISKQTFNYKEGSYNVILKSAIKDRSNKPILFYELGKQNPISFSKGDKKFNAYHLKDVLDNKNLQELTLKNASKIYWIIIGVLILAVIFTGAWGIWNMNEANKRIVELSLQIANMTKTGSDIIVK